VPPNHDPRPTPRSNPQIDGAAYQLLYEMERRLDEKFHELRDQSKEDIKAALAPIFVRLDTIDGSVEEVRKRLAEGSQQFRDHVARLDDHSDRITVATDLARAKQAPAKQEGTAAVEKKGGWAAKVGEKIVLPIVIGAVTVPAALWVMLQIKMIAWADATPAPTMAQPTRPPGTPP
jgi:cytochrome c-type biogenesis protein CcmH/NrfG